MEHTENNPTDSNDVTNASNAPDTDNGNTPTKTQPSFLGEIIKFSILAILIVVPIRLFIAQPFIVSGASMEPTFETGQYLIVDQLSYSFNAPQRGEVIIFRFPQDTSKFFIKRVIGLPGETIQLRGKDIIIKNAAHTSGFILDEPYLDPKDIKGSSDTITLSDEEYFVMGDNRDESSDSRIWGPLEEGFIVGRAFIRVFPLGLSGVLPGDHSDLEEK